MKRIALVRRRRAALVSRRGAALGTGLATLMLGIACGGGDSPTGPGLPTAPSTSVSLEGSSTLIFQSPDAFGDQRSVIEAIVKETLAAARQRIPLNAITVIARIGTQNVIPEIGFGGRADGGTIFLTFDSRSSLWRGTIGNELFALVAHEMHHVARIRAVGFARHLLDAMILEGLADQFSVELAGVAPPRWSVALRGAELQEWAEKARAEWFNTGYDHNAWFFGSGAIPRWAGYSIGFAITGAYIAADASRSASSLYREPSGSFTQD